jgi:hypothetical protein
VKKVAHVLFAGIHTHIWIHKFWFPIQAFYEYETNNLKIEAILYEGQNIVEDLFLIIFFPCIVNKHGLK